MNKAKILAIILAVVGLVDAIYLIAIKYANNKALCFISAGDCLSVNSSVYSEIAGIPIAALGAAAFLAILTILVLEPKWAMLTRWSPYLIFSVTLIGVIYSAYLTYLEIAVIKAVCPFCVLSAVCMLALFVISIFRFSQSPLE